jgi:hypothetical protein
MNKEEASDGDETEKRCELQVKQRDETQKKRSKYESQDKKRKYGYRQSLDHNNQALLCTHAVGTKAHLLYNMKTEIFSLAGSRYRCHPILLAQSPQAFF